MNESSYQPLASRMRPAKVDNYVGQEHLLAPGKPLRESLQSGQLHSMIFWGPPGVGKTTLARLFAEQMDARFIAISAVLSGVKEIRAAIEQAQDERRYQRRTILFVDEVHRFNKAQQDAFLPYVEDGTLIFIGATTENPSFELNNALLSRARVYVLKPLSPQVIENIITHALESDRELKAQQLSMTDECRSALAAAADGDARRALNLLEIAAALAASRQQSVLDKDLLAEVAQQDVRRFDKGGDIFHDQISALHKAVRGSSPDAALYWFARMLDGGCDPLYIARRVVRMASEDIGNADPRALQMALNAWDVQERLGSPEGELTLAQAVIYMACAPKSNAVYEAFNTVKADVAQTSSQEVPLHIRNAPTALMKSMDYGKDYRYAHHFENAFVAGESYFPEALKGRVYYQPVERGLEIQIAEKLRQLKSLNEKSDFQRWSPVQESLK
jgi:putative ATPase